MGFFSATQQAAAEGRVVALAILARFDFAEGEARFWLNGSGVLVVDSEQWQGIGTLVSVGTIETGEGDSADRMTITLSGVNSAVVALAAEAESVRGRDVTLYGQFFDTATRAELDDKFIIPAADVMDTVGYAAEGPSQRSVTITAESIWTARNVAKYAMYSVGDQEARFAGDGVSMTFIPALRHKQTKWPILG